MQNNETCSLCNVCDDIHSSFDNKLCNIGDSLLYNIRYGLNRTVNYNLYKLLKAYKPILDNICDEDNCDFCYGQNIESVLERVKILTTL